MLEYSEGQRQKHSWLQGVHFSFLCGAGWEWYFLSSSEYFVSLNALLGNNCSGMSNEVLCGCLTLLGIMAWFPLCLQDPFPQISAMDSAELNWILRIRAWGPTNWGDLGAWKAELPWASTIPREGLPLLINLALTTAPLSNDLELNGPFELAKHRHGSLLSSCACLHAAPVCLFVQKSWRDLLGRILALCSLLFFLSNQWIQPFPQRVWKYTSASCIEWGTSFLLPAQKVLGPQQKVLSLCSLWLSLAFFRQGKGKKVRTGGANTKCMKMSGTAWNCSLTVRGLLHFSYPKDTAHFTEMFHRNVSYFTETEKSQPFIPFQPVTDMDNETDEYTATTASQCCSWCIKLPLITDFSGEWLVHSLVTIFYCKPNLSLQLFYYWS